jgi:hypothetical protein
MRKIQFALLTVCTTLVVGSSASALTVYGLTTRDQLVVFDSASPEMLQSSMFIQGLMANESLIGIDFRPATGALYGAGSFGNLYVINPMNAQATLMSTISVPLNGVEFGMDFNPVPDRLRLIGDLGQNLRINVDTGAALIDGSINPGGFNIVASAYTNSFAGATTTTLYNIDSVGNRLTIQTPPNNGTQVPVGPLGFDVSALAGMDIFTLGGNQLAFAAFQLTGTVGSGFYSIDLATGNATPIGMIGVSQSNQALAIRDISVVPEPASLAIVGLGLAALAARRRRKSS